MKRSDIFSHLIRFFHGGRIFHIAAFACSVAEYDSALLAILETADVFTETVDQVLRHAAEGEFVEVAVHLDPHLVHPGPSQHALYRRVRSGNCWTEYSLCATIPRWRTRAA